MNVSSQSLRRRQSINTGTQNRPLRRGPTFNKKRSSQDLKRAAVAQSSNNNVDSNNISHYHKNRRANNVGSTNDISRSSATKSNILNGVVACLSGQTEEIKNHIHNIIHKLGGQCQGNFDPQYITHLITDTPTGSKYDFWQHHLDHENNSYEWAEKLIVVTSSWVEACEKEGQRVSEEKYKLQESGAASNGIPQQPGQHEHSLPIEIPHTASLEEKCDWMIEHHSVNKYCNLFSGQSFLLVGFDDHHQEDSHSKSATAAATTGEKSDARTGFSNNNVNLEATKGKISKLIRRAGGTIFWEPNEWITSVLLNDHYSKHTWDDVRYFCREHPKGPICVSVDWILISIYHNTIIATPFPAEPQQQLKIKARISSGGSVSSNNTTSIAATKSKLKRKSKTSSIFRGDVFAVVKLTTIPPGTLEYSYEDMEATVISNGGLLLSKTILLAAQKDAKKLSTATNNLERERKYYVVTPRIVPLDAASPFPLIAELSKVAGIKVSLVTPVWIAACIKDKIVHDPYGCPLLFKPQTWSIRLLHVPKSEKKGASTKKTFLISVSGFQDASRYAIISMLNEIGAECTDALSRKNTHLICKEAKGKKYTKGLEWGMHVVSIEWVYHIVRYGYDEGSEARFQLIARKDPVEAMQQPETKESVRASLDFDEEIDAPDDGDKDSMKEEQPEMNRTRMQQPDTNVVEKAVTSLDFDEEETGALGNGDNSMKEKQPEMDRTGLKRKSRTEDMTSETSEGLDFDSKVSAVADEEEKKEDEQFDTVGNSPSSSQASSSRQGKRDLPQASPTLDEADQDSLAASKKDPGDTKQRLQFALHTLSGTQSSPQKKKRRGKREKSPKSSQDSMPAPLPRRRQANQEEEEDDDDGEEDSPRMETQFTVGTIGTIYANAEISAIGNEAAPQVPLSALSAVEDNGESQLIWFAGSRRG